MNSEYLVCHDTLNTDVNIQSYPRISQAILQMGKDYKYDFNTIF